MESNKLDLDDLYEIFPDDVREELFIRIKESYFQDMIWKNWPKSTKAIVPVIKLLTNLPFQAIILAYLAERNSGRSDLLFAVNFMAQVKIK